MGTNYIAPTWRQPENLNKDKLSNYSIDFNGINNVVQIARSADLEPANITVSCWVNVAATGSHAFGYFVSKIHTAGSSVSYGIYKPATPTFIINIGGVIKYSPAYGTDIQGQGWHHLVGTYDGAHVRLYVNGTEVGSGTGTIGNIDYTTEDAYIGSFEPSLLEIDGEISQVCIFDYALTDGTDGTTDQINYLYNLNNPMVIDGAEPVAYWPLGDNSNPTATAGYPNIVSAADSVFDFGTSNEEIDTPGPYTDGTQGDLTISAWVKQDSITTSYRPIVCTGFTTSMTQPQVAMALRNVGGNRLYLFYNGGGGSNYIYAQNVMTEANRWYHCAFVRSGSTGKLYVDGQEVSTLNSADFSVSPQVTTADSEMTLGGWRYSGSNESLNGELSNVCLWETALTDGVGGQIEELYNNGMPLLELSELPQNNNLLGWYKLNQSAVLTPGVPTNWTITKVGNPNYSGSNDGCYAGTSGTSPYNSGLVWHDNNSGATVGSDYFQWNSPTIYTSGSNIVLSSSGGSYNGQFGGGSQAILEYNIDDGSWVNWHTQTNPTTGSSITFTIPSTGNLAVSNNIKIRIKGVDFGGMSSYLKINDINATGGTSSYNESFTNATRYGFSGGSETQPPATFSADNWDIPDNRSAYPQSFEFNTQDYIEYPYVSINGAFTVSTWVKTTDTNTYGNLFSSSNQFGGGPNIFNNWKLIRWSRSARFNASDSSNSIIFDVNTGTSGTRPNLYDGNWHHVLAIWDGTTNSNGVKIFFDGVLRGLGAASSTAINTDSSIPIRAGSSSATLDFIGEQSNQQIWNTALTYGSASADGDIAGGEVATIYNNGVPLPTASIEPSSLKVWAKLDSSSKWNTITSQWNIPLNPITPTPWSKSAITKSNSQTFVNNTSASGIDLTNPTTCSFWIRTATTQVNFAISAGSFGGGNDLAVIGSRILVYRGASNYRYWNFNSSIINDDNWHNIVIYSPGYATADIGSTRMFMDGLELSIDTTLQSSPPGTPNNNPILGVGNIYVDMISASFSNAVIWASDQTSNINEIYNNGTPSSSYTNTPILWWELNNLTSGLDDLSGNNNNGITSGPVFTVTEEDIIAYQLGVSDGMTEANLIDENVSTVNGESDTLPASALVQSDLTRKLPFSDYSITFDGIADEIALTSNFVAAGEFTLSLWINPDNVADNNFLGNGSSSNNWMQIKTATQLKVKVASTVTTFNESGGNDLTASAWNHVLIYRNASNDVGVYVNGQTFGSPSNNTNTLTLSTIGRATSIFFEGNINNVAFWSSALTQEEVLDVYNNGIPTNLNTSFTPGPPNYWWPMDEDYTYFNGSVLVARDAVGSNDGTGVNIIQENIVGNAPGSEANGIGTNLTIADLKGDMKSSTNNSYSINMADYADGVTNPADSGRSTNVP